MTVDQKAVIWDLKFCLGDLHKRFYDKTKFEVARYMRSNAMILKCAGSTTSVEYDSNCFADRLSLRCKSKGAGGNFFLQ